MTELYLRNESVFIRKGELMLELNTYYERNSRQDLVPVNGGAALIPTTRKFFETILIARYGLLTDRLEVNLIAPVYLYAEQTADFGVTQTTTMEEGVDDIGGAVRYEAGTSRGSGPVLFLEFTESRYPRITHRKWGNLRKIKPLLKLLCVNSQGSDLG